jgi:ribosomal protein S27AE
MLHTAWQTDEPCPSCGAGMVLLDAGLPAMRAECRMCGHVETWDSSDTEGGDW